MLITIVKIIFRSMFQYFIENELFTVCQPDFLSDDYWTSQLLSIIYKIQKSFDEIPPMSVSLDISKAFSKVWQREIIYKLKSYGIFDNLRKLIQNYLTDRKQRSVLSDQTFSWERALLFSHKNRSLGF